MENLETLIHNFQPSWTNILKCIFLSSPFFFGIGIMIGIANNYLESENKVQRVGLIFFSLGVGELIFSNLNKLKYLNVICLGLNISCSICLIVFTDKLFIIVCILAIINYLGYRISI